MRRALLILILCLSVASLAHGFGAPCNPAGTWYGGSLLDGKQIPYQMTIIPTLPSGHYVGLAQGLYKNDVANTFYTGELVQVKDRLEGPTMQLASDDPVYLGSFPPPSKPGVNAGWMVLEFVDCNTLKNTIRTFGSYTAKSIWEDHKVPLRDPFDFDIIQNLLGGQPIVETYHRMPSGCEICKKK